jgi:5-methylcytosine-specific restriction endonuclease McrA
MPSSNRIAQFRATAFHSQFGLCFYCGLPMFLGDSKAFAVQHEIRPKSADLFKCTAEHLVPRGDGGTDSPENIAAAHRYCNQRRHHRKIIPAPDKFGAHVRNRVASGRWWPNGFPVQLTGPV